MTIRSGPGATIEIVLPEIEEAAKSLYVNPAWLVEEIIARVDWRSLLPAIGEARGKEAADNMPLFKGGA